MNLGNPDKTYAIIIAIENYQFNIKKVDYATNDAREFQMWLTNNLKVPQENIKLWIDVDATKSALNEELQYEISRLNEDDRFIFYYAGHGFFDGGHNRITTWDTHPNNIKGTSASINQVLMEPLRNSRCNQSLIFIDACASSLDEQLISRDLIANLNSKEFIDFVRSSNYRAMFLSCSRGEKSYGSPLLGHGIWTYFLLKALKGEAIEVIIQDRFITSSSLQNYLSKVVPDFIRINTDIRGTQKPWAEISSSNTFAICEILDNKVDSENNYFDFIYIPERIIFDVDKDLIFAPLKGLENDGRNFPMFDYEGLKEIDVEAYCIRISKIKAEITNLLEEIIEFLMEYEWSEEVSFEREGDKFNISASLYEDIETSDITVSLGLCLKISGFHPMGDIIFDSEFDTANNELKISTDSSDFDLNEAGIQDIFMDCWDEIRKFFLLEEEFSDEINE